MVFLVSRSFTFLVFIFFVYSLVLDDIPLKNWMKFRAVLSDTSKVLRGAFILHIFWPGFIISPSFFNQVIFNVPPYFFWIYLNVLSNQIFPQNIAFSFDLTNAIVVLFLSFPNRFVVMSPFFKSSEIAIATSFIAIFFRLVLFTKLFPWKVFFR